MKLSSIQRWLFEAINFVLVVTFTLPLSVLLGQFFHYDAPWLIWILCVTILGHLAGRITMHADALLAQIACGVTSIFCGILVGTVLHQFTGGLSAHLVGNIAFIVLALFGSTAFFFSARKAGYTIYAPMTTVGLILHILALIVVSALQIEGQVRTISSVAAIAFFILSLYAFNASGLRKSVHAKESAKSAHLPRGIQMSSFLLVTGFVLLTVLLSWIGPAIPVVFAAVGRAFLMVIRFFSWLIGLADKLGSTTGVPAQEETAETDNGLAGLMDEGAKEHSDLINGLVNAFSLTVVAILAIVLLYMVYKKFLKGMKGVQEFLNRLRGLFEPEQTEDYVDEEESLFSWKGAVESATEGFRGILKRITDRPQKFDDFKTGRLKIRFVYQQLLKQRMGAYDGAVGRYETPNEMLKSLPADAGEFIKSYNSVRYNDGEPSSKEVSLAKALLPRK